jgi:hypothetical protein
MSHEKFKPDDLFVNTIKTHPDLNVFIYNSQVYLGKPNFQGQNTRVYSTAQEGHLSLFELNIDRSSGLIYPFVDGGSIYTFPDRKKFNVISHTPHNGSTGPHTTTQGTYPLSASVSRILTVTASTDINPHVASLRTPALSYAHMSPHYQFSGSMIMSSSTQLLSRNILTSSVNMINFPYVFYGSSLKKGSVKLKYYITGSLIAECADTKHNGELVETTGSAVGSVVGVVMYNEGVLVLTASHALDTGNEISYDGTTNKASASWMYFGAGAFDNITHNSSSVSASFAIESKGTSYTQVLTMMCHAKKGELNNSNNPTNYDYQNSSFSLFHSTSYSYTEPAMLQKNIVSSSYSGHEEKFDKTTYISKVGIYDENDNLIMIASLANPKRKKENEEFTIKLTYDI